MGGPILPVSVGTVAVETGAAVGRAGLHRVGAAGVSRVAEERGLDEAVPQAAGERVEQVGEADAEVHIVDDAVPERLDSRVHQVDAQLDVGPRRPECERLEQEHGAADDAEIRPDRGVLEVVARQEPFDHGPQQVAAAVDHLPDVFLVGCAETAQLPEG